MYASKQLRYATRMVDLPARTIESSAMSCASPLLYRRETNFTKSCLAASQPNFALAIARRLAWRHADEARPSGM